MRRTYLCLWVEGESHEVVRVPLEDPNTFPLPIPTPCLDRHIITTREDDAERRMQCQASNVVGVRFKRRDRGYRY